MWPFIVLPILALSLCKSVFTVQLKTRQGMLEGITADSREGRQFSSFYAIPYVKPPLDELRFEPPQDAEPWEGVRDATEPPSPCLQSLRMVFTVGMSDLNPVYGEEDCLFLDVHTPNVKPTTLMPVLVFFHGGAFHFGSGSINGPEYFMDHPIVLVIVQYRLNVFGFLSMGDEVLPGNLGLKDQVASLRWIQKNIDVFGGDPKRVTITGESAGAVSVNLHFYSPLGTGLFHAAVSESGSALAVWGVRPSQVARERTRSFSKIVGCTQSDTALMVKCLRKVEADEMITAFDQLYMYDMNPLAVLGPVVEPKNVKGAFLIESPWKQNTVNSVPWMIGINKDEGNLLSSRIFSAAHIRETWNRDFDRMICTAFSFCHLGNATALSAAIKKHYFKDNPITAKSMTDYKQMITDGYFLADSLEAAKRHINTVYFYYYTYKAVNSFDWILGNLTEDIGVGHGDEMIMLYPITGAMPPINTDDPDYLISKRVVDYWVNFCAKGDPNGKEQKWRPFKLPDYEYLKIGGGTDVMEKNLRPDAYKFWKDLLFSFLDHELSAAG